MRAVVPDLRAIVADYLQNKIKSDEFLIALHVGYEEDSDSRLKNCLRHSSDFRINVCMMRPDL